jgi:two-component system chemotaxis response regulator CheY
MMIADAPLADAAIVISGMDAYRRIAARSCARSMGIELQSLLTPLAPAALHVCLANLAKATAGPPITTSGAASLPALLRGSIGRERRL